jgi:RNA polymerase sigma-70 factor (ECF subfamily)
MTGQTSKGVFPPTRWTCVLAAARADTPRAQAALAELCQSYWYPLYAYARRRGHAPEDAEDFTQAFFVQFLGKDRLAAADRTRGRFRSFLLAAMKHFLADEWDKSLALKRGARRVVSLDAELAESRFTAEPHDDDSPDRVFDRQWALLVLETVMRKLHEDYVARGQGALFDELRFCLIGDRSALPYSDIAARLGVTEGAVKVAVHRMRQRYRAKLREEIAQTVDSENDVEEELRFLFRALSR